MVLVVLRKHWVWGKGQGLLLWGGGLGLRLHMGTWGGKETSGKVCLLCSLGRLFAAPAGPSRAHSCLGSYVQAHRVVPD